MTGYFMRSPIPRQHCRFARHPTLQSRERRLVNAAQELGVRAEQLARELEAAIGAVPSRVAFPSGSGGK
jgi:hypothetical protein